ncbi:hypothetical protein [Sporosarcina sp. NPDC096371]|uniref:hypothetical protein n=1 Tax=Sporosarcina sp. NPDC096371 TaxID=3364530 RepID=UPI003814CB47
MNKSGCLFLALFCTLICEGIYGTVIANSDQPFPSIGESYTEDGNNPAIGVMEGYFNDINESRRANVDKWYVKEEAKLMRSFLDDKENQEKKLGLLNIRKARLLKWKELPYDYAEGYVPTRYIDQYANKKIFYVAVDYMVFHEDEYHINGINYFFVVLVLESDNWRIALIPHVPVNSIISDGYGFGTKDEKTFVERRLKFHIQ